MNQQQKVKVNCTVFLLQIEYLQLRIDRRLGSCNIKIDFMDSKFCI